VPSVSLSFLNRKTVNKQVCRICHEFAELKTERLCAVCSQDQSADPLALPRCSPQNDGDSSRAGCHELWLEGAGLDARPERGIDIGQG